MKIRLAKFEDLKDILILFRELDNKHINNRIDFKTSITDDRYKFIFKNVFTKKSNSILTVAEHNNSIIGFVLSKIIRINNSLIYKNQTIGEINYIIVGTNFKKKGIGKKLIEDTEDRLKKFGAMKIEIRVYNFNKELIPEKYGFQKKLTVYEKY